MSNNFSSWLSVIHQVDDSSGSDQAITFAAQRTLSNASTISPEGEEEEEDEEEFLVGDPDMEEGPSFRLGSISKVRTYIFFNVLKLTSFSLFLTCFVTFI